LEQQKISNGNSKIAQVLIKIRKNNEVYFTEISKEVENLAVKLRFAMLFVATVNN
jgi:hypothetical protein